MLPCTVPDGICRYQFHGQSRPGTLHALLQLGKTEIQLFCVIEKGERNCLSDVTPDFACISNETGGAFDGRLCQITAVVPLLTTFRNPIIE